MSRRLILTGLCFFLCFSACSVAQAGLDDFDTTRSVVDLNAFRSGGPQKDGIPALNYPKLVSVDKAGFLNDSDIIVGVVLEGKARAYPIRILNWHEIVNDRIGQIPVAVTWCPLTRSAVAFDRRMEGQVLEFGVSGLLYNSNVVMYDRKSDGLWSQLKSSALTGKHADRSLSRFPTEITTWKKWRLKNPSTLVLSQKTGHFRNYNKDPYSKYHRSSTVMFDTGVFDQRLNQKQVIFGVIVNNQAKAYPMNFIEDLSVPVRDRINGQEVWIHPLDGRDARVADKDGNIIPSVVAYWFAWSTFHQDTLVYQ